MKTCICCKAEKADAAFPPRGRGRSATCEVCLGKAPKETAVADSTPALEPVRLDPSLEVPAGYGVRASVEDGNLWIEQDRADDTGELYTHQVVLARHEAAQILDWISKQVDA